MEIKLQELFTLAKKEDMMMFCMEYAEGNTAFRNKLMEFLYSKYLTSKTTVDDYRKKMVRAFGMVTNIGGRWSSYEIPDWGEINSHACHLLSEGRRLLSLGNADVAATLATEYFAGVKETFDVNTYYMEDDELGGDITDYCEEAERLLLDSIAHPNISKVLQDKLVKQLQQIGKSGLSDELSNYGIYNFNDMLMQVNALTQPEEETLNVLEQQIKQHKGAYNEYEYVKRKIDFLRTTGRDEDADKEELAHMELPEIRLILVDRLAGKKDYDAALRLTNEGYLLAKAKEHRGSTRRWKEKELELYELKGDKEQQIRLCSELFIMGGAGKEYYKKLKKLVDKGEWQFFLHQLIDRVHDKGIGFFGQSNVADIYVMEHETERLYQLIKGEKHISLDVLNNYAQHTGNSHAEELLDVYIGLLKKEGETANVKTYARIANAMECMCKLHGGKAEAHKLAEYFRVNYRRRPSMMAEIKKF